MPELPEVEVLVRYLAPALRHRKILRVQITRPRVTRPNSPADLARVLSGARFSAVTRRGKYILFRLSRPKRAANHPAELTLLGHLGMTGRMYVQHPRQPLPRHAAAVLRLDRGLFVFEDPRYFGRLTLDTTPIAALGPEPLEPGFTLRHFKTALGASRQPVKVKLMDQALVAGIGNIYASEALFLARISPRQPARSLNDAQIAALRVAIRKVLRTAIRFGSTVPLDFPGIGARNNLFYYGNRTRAKSSSKTPARSPSYSERLDVYDRAGRPCSRCKTVIQRLVQAGRSTFFCPRCQPVPDRKSAVSV